MENPQNMANAKDNITETLESWQDQYDSAEEYNTFIAGTVQNFFLIWISRQTTNLHSPKTIIYLDQSFRFAPHDKQKSEIWWLFLARFWGNLAKISRQFLRIEREDVIPFWKFWTVQVWLLELYC